MPKHLRISRKSYYRKPYTRSNGTSVKGSRVKGATFTIIDRGTPGRMARGSKSGPHSLEKPWIRHEGKLGGPGYLSRPMAERHKLLDRCVAKWGYRSCLGSIMVLNRNSALKARYGPVITSDRLYLVNRYGGRGSFSK